MSTNEKRPEWMSEDVWEVLLESRERLKVRQGQTFLNHFWQTPSILLVTVYQLSTSNSAWFSSCRIA